MLLPAGRFGALDRVCLTSAIKEHGVLAQLPLKALLNVEQALDLGLLLGQSNRLALNNVLEVGRLGALVRRNVLGLLDLPIQVGEREGVLHSKGDALLALWVEITHAAKVGT